MSSFETTQFSPENIENKYIEMFENNLSGLEKDVEDVGGEERMQWFLENHKAIGERWTNRLKATYAGIRAVALGAAAVGTGIVASTEAVNWSQTEDQIIGSAAIVAVLGAIHQGIRYLKLQRKSKEQI